MNYSLRLFRVLVLLSVVCLSLASAGCKKEEATQKPPADAKNLDAPAGAVAPGGKR